MAVTSPPGPMKLDAALPGLIKDTHEQELHDLIAIPGQHGGFRELFVLLVGPHNEQTSVVEIPTSPPLVGGGKPPLPRRKYLVRRSHPARQARQRLSS